MQAWECSGFSPISGHLYKFSLYKGIAKFIFQAICSSKCILVPDDGYLLKIAMWIWWLSTEDFNVNYNDGYLPEDSNVTYNDGYLLKIAMRTIIMMAIYWR